ncbi:hypothetical protein CK203_033412 [Vitis vinifera]|uniref:Uncharacterized protein n=1 Tax=Vitis vinifera TaxID=29760 RepID=A0A438HMN7_VITVI|nr:hypothetical protein CK203_033412 [Vitis vinifera]
MYGYDELWTVMVSNGLSNHHHISRVLTRILSLCLYLTAIHQMYPQEEFFPETTSPENVEDDDGLSLES